MNMASESLPTIQSWRSAAEAAALKFTMLLHYFTKKVKIIVWSMHAFWYKGLAKKTKHDELYKKTSILKK